MKVSHLSILLVLAALPQILPADEVPRLAYEEVLEEEGFEPLLAGEDLMTEAAFSDFIKAKTIVDSERLSESGVRIYSTKRVLEGNPVETETFFEIEEIDFNGVKRYYVRELPADEAARLRAEAEGIDPDQLARGMRVGAAGMVSLGIILEREYAQSPFPALGSLGQANSLESISADLGGDGDCAAGLKRLADGLEAENMPEPWASPSPIVFMSSQACFLLISAEAIEAAANITDEQKERIRKALEGSAEDIEREGEEDVEGHRSLVFSADLPAGMTQTTEDGSYEFKKIAVSIDASTLVNRKTRIDGVQHANGESRPFFMETIYDDYRNVPGTVLYEPYLQIMRAGGTMTPDQEREIRKAQAELAKFEKQLAEMSDQERAMMERMVGPQIEQMRSLANGGAVEFRIVTTGYVLEPDFGILNTESVGAGAETSLLRMVQEHLATLGYAPGNTNGDLDKGTVVAITQYQAAKGIEITGQASPQLAGMLAADVDAL